LYRRRLVCILCLSPGRTPPGVSFQRQRESRRYLRGCLLAGMHQPTGGPNHPQALIKWHFGYLERLGKQWGPPRSAHFETASLSSRLLSRNTGAGTKRSGFLLTQGCPSVPSVRLKCFFFFSLCCNFLRLTEGDCRKCLLERGLWISALQGF